MLSHGAFHRWTFYTQRFIRYIHSVLATYILQHNHIHLLSRKEISVKPQLNFERKGMPNLVFANAEEFYETLGILCQPESAVHIRSFAKAPDESGYTKLVETGEVLNCDDQIIATAELLGSPLVMAASNHVFACYPYEYYTKALRDVFKKNKPTADDVYTFGCNSFKEYLKTTWHFKGEKIDGREGDLLAPDVCVIREMLSGNADYLYFFEKGLNLN